MSKKDIKEKYEILQQLEQYEDLLIKLKGESRDHWWKIVTPNNEYYISEDKSRDWFINFIILEIGRLELLIS